MKFYSVILNTLLCISCILFTLKTSAQNNSWELKKEKDGIKVYTRDVANFGLNEFRGETIINSSVKTIVSTLKDGVNMKHWVPDCESVEILKSDSLSQLHYTITSLPFPLANRDAILKLNYKKTSTGYKVEINGLPKHLPETKGLVRIPHLSGYWKIDSISKNQSSVVYQIHADPGGSVPTWLANSTAVSTPFNTLKNLQEYLLQQD